MTRITTPSREEDECFPDNHSLRAVEHLQPPFLKTDSPWPQVAGKASARLGTGVWVARTIWKKRQILFNKHQLQLRLRCVTGHVALNSKSQTPSAQSWADSTTGRRQVPVHWTGPLRKCTMCVWMGKMRWEDSCQASPSLHNQQLQATGVAKRELPSLPLQRASAHQVVTSGHPTSSIPGRTRASELMAGQDTPKGKGRKEAAAGLGTVFQNRQFRWSQIRPLRHWESREFEDMGKEIPPKTALWYTGFYWNLINSDKFKQQKLRDKVNYLKTLSVHKFFYISFASQ